MSKKKDSKKAKAKKSVPPARPRPGATVATLSVYNSARREGILPQIGVRR